MSYLQKIQKQQIISKIIIGVIFSLSFFVMTTSVSWAASAPKSKSVSSTVFGGLNDAAKSSKQYKTVNTAQDGSLSIYVRVAKFLVVITQLVGVILLVIIVYAGFLWLTAHGETAQVDKAKLWLRNGAIGLVITSLAYSIVKFFQI